MDKTNLIVDPESVRLEDQAALLMAGIQAVNAGLENQRLKDHEDHLMRIKAMETNERQFDKMLDYEWRKFNRIFWLSAIAIVAIIATALALIFVAKDADKGVWLITSTIIGVLALLAGRGLSRTVRKPQA